MDSFNWKQYSINYPELKLDTPSKAWKHYRTFGFFKKMIYSPLYPKLICGVIGTDIDDNIKSFGEYHLNLGFDEIYIYTKNKNVILDNNPRIMVIHQDVNLNNISHFTHVAFINKWLSFKNHLNIKDFIKEFIFDECAGILIDKDNLIFDVSLFKSYHCGKFYTKDKTFIKNTLGKII